MKIRLEIEFSENEQEIVRVIKDGTPLKVQGRPYLQRGFFWNIHEYIKKIDDEEVIVGGIILDEAWF